MCIYIYLGSVGAHGYGLTMYKRRGILYLYIYLYDIEYYMREDANEQS